MIFTNKVSRPFTISCGLLPGYETNNETQKLEKAQDCIGTWMTQRLQQGKKIVAGTILSGKFIYPMVDSEKGFQTEDAFHYKGMVRDDATEEEAEEILKDLAKTLATELQQRRVHIQYGDAYWILE